MWALARASWAPHPLLPDTGASSFSFSGGKLDVNGSAGASCVLTLSVTTTVNGQLTNIIPIGAVTTSNGASNPAATQASLTNLPGASISKAFSPNPILPNGVSTLTITVQNTNTTPLTDIALADTLPAGVSVYSSPSTNCSGTFNSTLWIGNVTVSTDPISHLVTVALATGGVAPSASCTITVPVTTSVTGCHLNTIPANALTDTEGASNGLPASDSLCVMATTSLSTTPSTGGTVGVRLNDTATLSGGSSPTGTVTFKLYSPADFTCSLPPIYTEGPVNLSGMSCGDYDRFCQQRCGHLALDGRLQRGYKQCVFQQSLRR